MSDCREDVSVLPQSATKDTPVCVHMQQLRHQCHICDKRFRTLDSFRLHKRTHTRRPYSCEFTNCLKSFYKSKDLQNHLLLHYGGRHFQCEVCKNRFLSKYTLSRHKKSHMRSALSESATYITERPYQCQVCNKRFKMNHHLIRHLVSHTGARKFVCQWSDCQRSFTRRATLKNHIEMHQGIRHICALCSKSFTTAFSLGRHMKLHESNNANKCNICLQSTCDRQRYPPLQSPAVPANKTNLPSPPLQGTAAAPANKTKLVSPPLQSSVAAAPANKTNMSTYTCGFCNIEYTLMTGLTRHMTSVHAIPSM